VIKREGRKKKAHDTVGPEGHGKIAKGGTKEDFSGKNNGEPEKS